MEEALKPADIVLTRGQGLLSQAIRFFTRSFGEKRTQVNHVGIVVEGGPIDKAIIVEALVRVVRHRLIDQYGGRNSEVGIYRPLDLTEEEIRKVLTKAEDYVGRKYGYIKLLLQL